MSKKTPRPIPATILWNSTQTSLPDDDITVLLSLEDGEIWTGFLDAGQWRYVTADPIEAKVTHWANFPPPPTEQCDDRGMACAPGAGCKLTKGHTGPHSYR